MIDRAGYTGACGLEQRPLPPSKESLLLRRALFGALNAE